MNRFEESVHIVEKYVSKRSILGINNESFAVLNTEGSEFYGEISLDGLSKEIENYNVPDFVTSIGIREDLGYNYYGIEHKGREIIESCDAKLRIITLGNKVRYIQREVFSEIPLEQVIIKGNIELIGERAFANCGNISEIDFTKCKGAIIGEQSFFGCFNLTYADLSDVKNILTGAFSYSGLADVILPELNTIMNNTFGCCDLYGEIIIKDSTKKLEDGCIGLSYSDDSRIIIGKGVKEIGNNAIHSIRRMRHLSNNNISKPRGKVTLVFTGDDIEKIDKEAFSLSIIDRIECNETIRKKLINICKVDKMKIFRLKYDN